MSSWQTNLLLPTNLLTISPSYLLPVQPFVPSFESSSISTNFHFSELREEDVLRKLTFLDTGKAMGTDRVPASLLRMVNCTFTLLQPHKATLTSTLHYKKLQVKHSLHTYISQQKCVNDTRRCFVYSPPLYTGCPVPLFWLPFPSLHLCYLLHPVCLTCLNWIQQWMQKYFIPAVCNMC